MSLFAAISIPDPMRQRLARWAGVLAREIPDPHRRLRWVKEFQFHITLKFFGETPEHRMPPLQAALRSAAKGQSIFNLSLGQTGHFGGRVIWVGVDSGHDEVLKIEKSIETQCSSLGFIRESKPFHPHITLARSKLNPGTIRLDQLAALPNQEHLEPFTVSTFDLIRSTLSPQGSVYDIMERYVFSG